MAQLTEADKTNLKQLAFNSCVSKGIPATIDSPVGPMPNPAMQACVTQEYNTALSEASKGKLSQWVQAHGGVTGILQDIAAVTSAIKDFKNTNQPPPGYSAGYDFNAQTGNAGQNAPSQTGSKSNIWIWVAALIFLIIVTIVIVVIVKKRGKAGKK